MKLPAPFAADEDYRAIARAVRGPMRRWWRKVGVWWLLATAALIGTVVFQTILELQRRQAGLFPTPSTWEEILNLFHWLTIPFAGMAFLLSVLSALASLQGLMDGGGLSYGAARLTSFRFRIALSQAVIPILISVVYLTVLDVRFGALLFGSEYWNAGDTLQLISGIGDSLFGVLIPCLWLSALLAIPHVPRWIAWNWYLACFAGGFNGLVIFAAIFVNFDYPFLMAQMDDLIVEGVGAALQIAGFGLTLLALRLMSLNRESGFRWAVFLGVMGFMSAMRVGLGSQPDHIGSIAYEIDYVLAMLYKLPAFNPIVGIGLLEDSGLKLLFFLFDYRWEFGISNWLFWIAWVIQAAIAAGYIWLIHFVITRGAAARSANSG